MKKNRLLFPNILPIQFNHFINLLDLDGILIILIKLIVEK